MNAFAVCAPPPPPCHALPYRCLCSSRVPSMLESKGAIWRQWQPVVALMSARSSAAILCAILCCGLLSRCSAHPVLFSIWGRAKSRAEFMQMYQDSVLCGKHIACPLFSPDLHKFDRGGTPSAFSAWTDESMSASRSADTRCESVVVSIFDTLLNRRSMQLRMFAAKALDVAATRALGCSPVYATPFLLCIYVTFCSGT